MLTDGRFELGIGAGGSFMPFHAWTGMNEPGIRIGRLAESLRTITGLFGESAVTFAGRYFSLSGLEGLPKPVQRPRPPVLVGGGGPRLLSLAVREADIVSIFPTMLPSGGRFRDEETRSAAVAAKVDHIPEVAGNRFSVLELNILVQVVVAAGSRQAGINLLSAEWGVPAEDAVDSPYVYVGTAEEMADDLWTYRERLGTSYFVILERHMDASAPVIAALAGR